jgi:uncharacterized protein (DUF1330 family)
MPAYVIVDITVRDRETYERYKQLAAPAVAAYGGRYLVRGGESATLEGAWAPQRCVILEFPSMQAGRHWWDSPEYAPAKALRQSCADTEMLLIDGVPSPRPDEPVHSSRRSDVQAR